jgi:hypothetical protein
MDEGTPEPLWSLGEQGIRAILAVYAERSMDVHLGQHLAPLAREVGFQVTRITRRARSVAGGSAEARFHKLSFKQLASSLTARQPEVAATITRFVECLEDSRLTYTTRTTVSVSATHG